eukprot:1944419-Rhodomonas_salina.1
MEIHVTLQSSSVSCGQTSAGEREGTEWKRLGARKREGQEEMERRECVDLVHKLQTTKLGLACDPRLSAGKLSETESCDSIAESEGTFAQNAS